MKGDREMSIMERFHRTGIVPVVVIRNAKDAVPAADALLAGGIDIMEVTMRTPDALESIRQLRAQRPEVLVGAGTVVTLDQCRKALEAGTQFIVAPGYDEEVVAYCQEKGVSVLPGCVTPTEIMGGLKQGLTTFKFFPAGVYGGIKAMKALSGPFGAIKFVPTGGVNGDNLEEYLTAPFIHAVGGSWMCTEKDIQENNWEKITSLSAQARAIVQKVRG